MNDYVPMVRNASRPLNHFGILAGSETCIGRRAQLWKLCGKPRHGMWIN